MRGFLVVAFVSLLCPPAATAQPAPPIAEGFIRRAWDTRDGLPQNTVTAMVQTRDGYLWLGTFGGLVRFDGHAFTVFNPGNTAGLASARITALLEDRRGTLWIGTESGLTRYEHGRFGSYSAKDGITAGVNALVEDLDGVIWVATAALGLSRFNGKTFDRVDFNGTTLSLAVTPDGDVWAGGALLARFRHGRLKDAWPVDGGAIVALRVDSAGQLWAGGWSLTKWDGERFTTIDLPEHASQHGGIRAIVEDGSGHLWIATARGGIFRWRQGSFDRYAGADGLGDDFIRSLAIDRDGNYWIGTDVGGLVRLRRRSVFSYQRPGGGIQSISPIVDAGDGGLWIGAVCGGLLHFRDGAFRVYSQRDGMPQNGCIWALHRDPDGTLWIGTAGSGLVRFRDGVFTTFGEDVGFGGPPIIQAIARERNGTLWVGGGFGLGRFESGRVRLSVMPADVPGGVRAIVQDRDDVLWLGSTDSGLHRFERERVTASYTTAQGLSNNHVRAIHQDADGVLWIGTYGGGLNRFKDGRFTPIREQDGLHDNAVSRIIEDERGNFWMSGNRGIFRVARSQLNDFADGRIAYITSVSYGTADGMIIDETNGGSPAGWRTKDGRFWFPTIKGLVEIRSESGTAPAPPVHVERAVVDGRPRETSALAALGPGRVDAEFHFTAVELGGAEKTRFRYRLDGYDAEGHWTDSGARRAAYYTNIPPGRYRFEVIATDREGQWTTAPARVALAVTPFLWQRREVQLAALVLLLIATSVVAREVSGRRARARVKELEREHALERERSRIARDLHDDLGSRLTHIAMIADGAAGDPRIAGEARDAARTMNELVWAVNARNDTVDGFAGYLSQFAEQHVSAAGLRCRLDLPPDLPSRPLGAQLRRHLYLACKEAVNNAVKHAQASEIRVALRVDGSRLVVEIADNGRGLPAALASTGNGLRNYRERMEAAGGTVDVQSAAGAGTCVTFSAPV